LFNSLPFLYLTYFEKRERKNLFILECHVHDTGY
jgi:hypothetical protein